MFLDYSYTYPNAKINYHAINMILHVESGATYLVMPGCRSFISGHYYLCDHPTNPTNPSYDETNGLILT